MATPATAPQPDPSLSVISKPARWAGLGIVVLVGVVPLILSSSMSLFSGKHEFTYGNPKLLSMMLHEITCLLVLWYVLNRSSRRFADLGFAGITVRTALHGLGLALAALFASVLIRFAVADAYRFWYGDSYRSSVKFNFEGAAFSIGLAFIFLNPWFEELVVRAFITTEVTSLCRSAFLAGAASVVIQTSYHLYQGWLNAIAVGSVFTVFAIYYGIKKNIFPVIIAHAVIDLYAFLLNIASTHK
jgi:membrane protease YdiL (CAAX protease family)